MPPASRVRLPPIRPLCPGSRAASRTTREAGASAVSRGSRQALMRVVMPLLLLAGMTAVFRLTPADVASSRLFYGGQARGWSYGDPQAYRGVYYLYRFGVVPGLAMGIGGLLVGLLSFAWPRLRPWRSAGLFLAAMLVVGPGLLINSVAKPWFQRPRPCHIVDFGGDQAFVPVWERGPAEASPDVGLSFPSGHAAIGFVLMAPAFLLFRRHPRWARAFLLLGLTGGCVMGLGRVAQGDHFVSDVFWAGGVVYFSGLVLRHFFQLASALPRGSPA
jgi:lipid A 4'-phosphatase